MSVPRVLDHGPVAVVAAMDEELAPLASRIGASDLSRRGDLRLREGTVGRRRLLLAVSGDGRERARRSTESLLESHELGGIIVIGVSGGLTPGLDPGALVIARRVLDGDTVLPAPDSRGSEAASRIDGARAGTVVSVDRIACSVEEKAELRSGLPDGSAPAVVDLESAVYARVAAARGIPFLVARAICDPAEKPLPFDLNRCLDEGGGIDRAKVLRYAMFHPAVLGPLMALREQVGRCAGILADFVENLLDEPGSARDRTENLDDARSRG